MAKFHNYYVLCPLIDQKSFLGVSRDDEHVIVTLGRNVVNKYRLSDQKQVSGWTSRDHITSEVIYDKDQQAYAAVFNNNTIKFWKEDCANLDKLKKYKFSINIFRIIQRLDHPSLIIFSNGNCASLPYAIENRKSYEGKSFIKESDIIVDYGSYSDFKTDYVCYIVKNIKGVYEIIHCPLRNELGDLEKSKVNRVKITRNEDVYVVGKTITTYFKYNEIYILWSDAKMTCYNLIRKTWSTVGTVPWISTVNSVSLTWMGKCHLILFGSNLEQDGAVIVAYNVRLGVGSCRYPMKMYTENAKLYCYNDTIILEASNHIGMLPYTLEVRRNLSRLLGSHEVVQDEQIEIANWDTPTEATFKMSKDVKKLVAIGLKERNICHQIIPSVIEKEDFRKVSKVIQEFKDVPESILVMLLNYAIKLINPDDVDITNKEKFLEHCKGNQNIQEKAKFELLNYLFKITFSDALLIPYLRSSLTLDSALYLMMYISYLLVESEIQLDTEYESKLFDWCTLLMDAFYQQYLITNDQKVTYVLDTIKAVLSDLINQLFAVDSTMPLLNRIISGKQANNEEEALTYTIELLSI